MPQLDAEENADEAERDEEELIVRWRWKNPILNVGVPSSFFGFDVYSSQLSRYQTCWFRGREIPNMTLARK